MVILKKIESVLYSISIITDNKAGETVEEVVPEAVGIGQLTAGYLKLCSLIFIQILLPSGQPELTSAATASEKHSTIVSLQDVLCPPSGSRPP